MSAAWILKTLFHRNNCFTVTIAANIILCVFYASTTKLLNQLKSARKGRSDIDVQCPCVDDETQNIYEFCYKSISNGTNVTGMKFSCKWLPYLKRLNLLNPDYSDKPVVTQQVFVTGASSDHMAEALDHLGSLIEKFSEQNNTRIIFYDFDLKEDQRIVAQNLCHVEYRKFNFSNYPDNVHKMKNYRWKFLLLAELMTEFDSVWWGDSSIRWRTNNLSKIYNAVNSQALSPFLLFEGQDHSILSTTHEGMFKYLPVDMNNTYLKEEFCGCLLFFARSTISAQIMKWAVLCSLEPECLEPIGAKLHCWWHGGGDRWIHWAGCHRYDQSMINVLLYPRYYYNESKFTPKIFPHLYLHDTMRDSKGAHRLKTLCS